MKCIKGVTNHVISSIKGISLSKLFVIKKNVNSTKDYGFENSNDKCFFFVIYCGLSCLEMYLRLISPIRFFTFLLYLWSPLV